MNEQNISVHIFRTLIEKKLFSFPSGRLWYLFAECCSHFKTNEKADQVQKYQARIVIKLCHVQLRG